MDNEQTAAYLKEETDEARTRVSRALLKWENRRRRESRLAELPASTAVWLPTGPAADLRMLTLVVWRTRYRVTLEWLLDAVLTRFKNQRRLPAAKDPEELSLGVPAALLVSEAARTSVEERLLREFPDQENLKAARQPRQSPMPDLPRGDMIAGYMDALAAASAAKSALRSERPYRRA